MDNLYQSIINKVKNGSNTCIKSTWINKEGEVEKNLHKVIINNFMNEGITKAFEEGIPQLIKKEEEMTLIEPFFTEERLFVLGGGHVAIPLVEFASKVGFSVTVVDDRISFANKQRFPLAKQVICDNFEHALNNLEIRESDYIVIITRGHRYDSDCLKTLCQGMEPTYIGMIGSRKRTRIVLESLETEGCDKEKLKRVHTPIGLNIGAITPEEIAISILAEVISHKRLGSGSGKKLNRSDIDYEVLDILAKETDVSKVLITIMETKGSVPRGAGAKMIVYADGRIKGSIGGGCSEAAVIGIARRMVGTGQYKVMTVDLTGEVAEEEGMVCGGIMTVLLEDYKDIYPY